MIAGAKVSIVDPTPGVTRDRVAAIVELPHPDGEHAGPSKPVEIIDTGGVGVYVAEGRRFNEVGEDLATLTKDIEFQIAQAIASADIVLFAVDTQAGITAEDQEIARRLREGKFVQESRKRERAKESRTGETPVPPGKEQTRTGGMTVPPGKEQTRTGGMAVPPGSDQSHRAEILVVATKVDGPRWEAHAHELAGLGFGEPLLCSATSNYMRRDLLDRLYEITPTATDDPQVAADLKIAIVGKRNAGKSTLVNALAGEPRVIVSEIAGTTRDAVDVRFEMDGRSILAIDTAGLRRKKSFADRIEWFAFDRAKRAIDRADVILMLIDATEKVSQVDEQLAMLIQKAFKPVVIVVNKWDLVEGTAGPTGKPITPEAYEAYLRKALAGLSFAPISLMSAAGGLNIRETINLAFDLHGQAGRRVTTGVLNRLVRGILELRGPPNKLGSQVKLLYVAQVSVQPPTIVLVVNRPELFTAGYERFLLNRFREELPFGEVPIRLVVRGRRRDGEAELEAAVTANTAARADGGAEDMLIDDEVILDAEAYFDDDVPDEPREEA